MTKRILIILFLIVSFGIVSQANADLILNFGDEWYVGRIVNGAPSSLADQTNWINYLIGLNPGDGPEQIPVNTGETYDRIGSVNGDVGSFQTAVEEGAYKQDNSNNELAWGSNFLYIYAKYGGDARVWYIAGYDFNEGDKVFVPGNSLSHTSGHNSVPEPATAFLLGIGLIGLAAVGRKRIFKK